MGRKQAHLRPGILPFSPGETVLLFKTHILCRRKNLNL